MLSASASCPAGGCPSTAAERRRACLGLSAAAGLPRAERAGWWEPAVRAGEAVRAGQVLGTVSTLDGGAVVETFTAPADGVVLFLTTSPAVAADGLLLGLAR